MTIKYNHKVCEEVGGECGQCGHLFAEGCELDTEEIWKDIKGYKGCYQISNFGRVKSLKRKKVYADRILKPSKLNCESGTVSFYKEGWVKEEFCIYKLALKYFGKSFIYYQPPPKFDMSCVPVKYNKKKQYSLYCCRTNPITVKCNLCYFCGKSHKGIWKLLHRKEE